MFEQNTVKISSLLKRVEKMLRCLTLEKIEE